MSFEDNFSAFSPVYRQYRPQYPGQLFRYLASLVPSHELAWDVGTGNGQAALGLSQHFARVVATDASTRQTENALRNERIEYRVSPAESVKIDSHSVDLVTAAQSLHWFDPDAFYAEVKRVLKPDGIFAAWCYYSSRITPEIDAILDDFNRRIVWNYWSPRLKLVADHYATIPFPFEESPVPDIEMMAVWSLTEMEGFLHSWSATQSFTKVRGYDPVGEIHPQLSRAWGNDRERLVRWPLYFRIGSTGGITTYDAVQEVMAAR